MNEQCSTSAPRTILRSRRRMAALLVSFVLGGAFIASAFAQAPTAPDFFWPYGKVLIGGANLDPVVQPVVAFVNGNACGSGETLVATAAEGTPADDVGKTVYVLDVLADGTSVGQRPGCGHPGDAVTLYFPASHSVASQQPTFVPGGQRVDLDLGTNLPYRQQAALVVVGE